MAWSVFSLLVVLQFSYFGLSHSTTCNKRCDTSVNSSPLEMVPSSSSSTSNSLLQPSNHSCHYHTFPSLEAEACMKNTWILAFGGSTTNVLMRRTMSFFENGNGDTSFHEPEFWLSLDHIWVTKEKVIKRKLETPFHVTKVANITSFLQHGSKLFSTAIHLRISYVVDNFILNSPGVIEGLTESFRAFRHKGGKVIIINGPFVVWYKRCYHPKFKYECLREEMQNQTLPQLTELFRSRLVPSLTANRLAKKNNFISHSIFLPGGNIVADQDFNDILSQEWEKNGKYTIRLWNKSFMSAMFSTELYDGHPTGVYAQWFLIHLLTLTCPLPLSPTSSLTSSSSSSSMAMAESSCSPTMVMTYKCSSKGIKSNSTGSLIGFREFLSTPNICFVSYPSLSLPPHKA